MTEDEFRTGTTDQVDRGAHTELRFEKCAHGFKLTAGSKTYAFSTIEELTGWLREQYGEPWQNGRFEVWRHNPMANADFVVTDSGKIKPLGDEVGHD